MKERYYVESVTDLIRPALRTGIKPLLYVYDRRDPDAAVCWCTDVNVARKIATALNRQYRDGAERRAAQKAHA